MATRLGRGGIVFITLLGRLEAFCLTRRFLGARLVEVLASASLLGDLALFGGMEGAVTEAWRYLSRSALERASFVGESRKQMSLSADNRRESPCSCAATPRAGTGASGGPL